MKRDCDNDYTVKIHALCCIVFCVVLRWRRSYSSNMPRQMKIVDKSDELNIFALQELKGIAIMQERKKKWKVFKQKTTSRVSCESRLIIVCLVLQKILVSFVKSPLQTYFVYTSQIHCHSDIEVSTKPSQAITSCQIQFSFDQVQKIALNQQFNLGHCQVQAAVSFDTKEICVSFNICLQKDERRW